MFAIAAGIAGLAGGLFAQSNAFVTLDVLSFARSGTVLIVLILGGVGRLYGAFVGATVYYLLEDQLAKISPEFWQFGVGLVLVLVVLFARGGLLGLLDAVRALAPRPLSDCPVLAARSRQQISTSASDAAGCLSFSVRDRARLCGQHELEQREPGRDTGEVGEPPM